MRCDASLIFSDAIDYQIRVNVAFVFPEERRVNQPNCLSIDHLDH